ncbi:MAG: BON domain-containing protein [Rhodothermales bacterium]|nr:BON domain-containing protein [Rhodothermales bacterium]
MPAPTPPTASPSRLPNVRALLDKLRDRRARTDSDRFLARRLYVAFERLSAAEVAVQHLHFYVYEGAVSVYGIVPTEAKRDAVLSTVAALPGVARITDHLEVA